MSDKEIKKLTDLAKRIQKEKRTKEEALAILVSAGIMTKKGNHTKPYRDLARATKK
jgi:hypothetical protein